MQRSGIRLRRGTRDLWPGQSRVRRRYDLRQTTASKTRPRAVQPRPLDAGRRFGSLFNFPEELRHRLPVHPLACWTSSSTASGPPMPTSSEKIPAGGDVLGQGHVGHARTGTGKLGAFLGPPALGPLDVQIRSALPPEPEPSAAYSHPREDSTVVALGPDPGSRAGVRASTSSVRSTVSSNSRALAIRRSTTPAGVPDRAEQERLVGLFARSTGAPLRRRQGHHRRTAERGRNSDQRLSRRSTRESVDDIEDLDTVVGWLAEFPRPHGFAISETQFQVFILNASRRLFSDRFFTSSFRPSSTPTSASNGSTTTGRRAR